MRQFLYLDTDIINSIIAQKNKGIIENITIENGDLKAIKNNYTVEGGIDGKAEAGFWKLAKAEAALNLSISSEKENSKSVNSKEIIAKTLHDSAFDIAYDIVKPEKISFGEDSADLGQYIELVRVFDFIDLEYLENLFSKNGVIDFLKKIEKEKIENINREAAKGLNRQQQRQSGTKIKEEIRNLAKQSDKQFDDIHDVIVALKQIVPYSRMLVSADGYLIPVEDKYFRVDPSNMGFKYGGDMKCIGLITNIIGEDTNPNDTNNVFATLQFSVNEVLRAILPTRENNLYVIHPLAVYYEY